MLQMFFISLERICSEVSKSGLGFVGECVDQKLLLKMIQKFRVFFFTRKENFVGYCPRSHADSMFVVGNQKKSREEVLKFLKLCVVHWGVA